MAFESCAVCKSTSSHSIYELNDCPIYHVLPDGDGDNLLEFVTIELVVCDCCGHVFNSAFDQKIAQKMYETSLPTNAKVNALMADAELELASRILGFSNVPSPKVLEVGGGGADLSRAMCQNAEEVWLVDPSPELGNGNFSEKNLRIVNSQFPSALPMNFFDVLVAKQVLEHVQDPLLFLQSLRSVATDDCVLYLEVPSLTYILDNASVQDIHFAHVHYFSPNIIKALASQSGFKILEVQDLKDGHDQAYLLSPSQGEYEAAITKTKDLDVSAIRKRLNQSKEALVDVISSFDKRVALYGACAYSQSVIGMLADRVSLTCIFDDTKEFRGKYAPGLGSRVPICSPNEELLTEVDTIVITAYLHDKAITDKLLRMGFQGEIYTLRKDAMNPAHPNMKFLS